LAVRLLGDKPTGPKRRRTDGKRNRETIDRQTDRQTGIETDRQERARTDFSSASRDKQLKGPTWKKASSLQTSSASKKPSLRKPHRNSTNSGHNRLFVHTESTILEHACGVNALVTQLGRGDSRRKLVIKGAASRASIGVEFQKQAAFVSLVSTAKKEATNCWRRNRFQGLWDASLRTSGASLSAWQRTARQRNPLRLWNASSDDSRLWQKRTSTRNLSLEMLTAAPILVGESCWLSGTLTGVARRKMSSRRHEDATGPAALGPDCRIWSRSPQLTADSAPFSAPSSGSESNDSPRVDGPEETGRTEGLVLRVPCSHRWWKVRAASSTLSLALFSARAACCALAESRMTVSQKCVRSGSDRMAAAGSRSAGVPRRP
jgi:hypothetical protein